MKAKDPLGDGLRTVLGTSDDDSQCHHRIVIPWHAPVVGPIEPSAAAVSDV